MSTPTSARSTATTPAPRGPARTPARPPVRRLLPGVALSAAACALLLAVAGVAPTVSPLVLALALGAVVGSLAGALPRGRRVLAAARPGTDVVATKVLRAGVVLLGLQLSVPQVLGLGWRGLLVVGTTVAVTFSATLALGRRLRVARATTLLVATGFSICGAAAISAMTGVVERAEPDQDRRDDVAAALALVTVYGTLAIVVLPWLAGLLGLSDHQAGLWIGASVQEVAQVVAAAGAVSAAALATATVAKLARVVLLAPLVTGAGAVASRRATGTETETGTGTADPGARPARRRAPVPGFVVGFLVAVAVRSLGLLPAGVLDVAHTTTTVLFVAAMFALGLGVDVPRLLRTGRRTLLLGGLSALVATGTALVATLVLV